MSCTFMGTGKTKMGRWEGGACNPNPVTLKHHAKTTLTLTLTPYPPRTVYSTVLCFVIVPVGNVLLLVLLCGCEQRARGPFQRPHT